MSAGAVLLATGAEYRRLPVDGLEEYEGISVFYAAAPLEGQLCAGKRVAVVGGGNSAGQAAIWLARGGTLVTLLHRRGDLRETMSHYLIDDLARPASRSATAAKSAAARRGEATRGRHAHRRRALPFGYLFLFLGAEPCTDWLGDAVARDRHGFILTGADAGAPGLLETSVAGRIRGGRRPRRLDQALRNSRRRGRRGRALRARAPHPGRGRIAAEDALSAAADRSRTAADSVTARGRARPGGAEPDNLVHACRAVGG